jgi:hypothetical protein
MGQFASVVIRDPDDVNRDGPQKVSHFYPTDTADSLRRFHYTEVMKWDRATLRHGKYGAIGLPFFSRGRKAKMLR